MGMISAVLGYLHNVKGSARYTLKKASALKAIAVVILISLGFSLTYILGIHAPTVSATPNNTLNFQARLETASGAIAPDGDYNIEFKLYDTTSSSGSSQGSCTGDTDCLWTETRIGADKVHVANGYLTVDLGSVTSLPGTINWDQNLYLTMNIGGTGSPSWDGEMSPRLHLTAVPYALQAKSAEQLQTLLSGHTGTLQFNSLGADETINLPDITGGGTFGLMALQNTSTPVQQTGANFNIDGIGELATLDATGGTGSTLTIGSTNTATGAVNIAGSATSGTVSIGGASETGTITLGQSTVGQTINIGHATVATGNTQTINIGDSAAGTGVDNVTVGSTNGSSTTTINGGTGSTAINLTTGANGSINASAGGTGNINLTTNSASSGTVVKSATNSATAFQVQNATGTQSLLTVDTANNNIIIGGNESGDLQNWTLSGSTLAFNRFAASSFVANGYLYEIAGSTSNSAAGASKTVYYAKINSDGSIGAFNSAANQLPQLLWKASATVANGYAYVLGGNSSAGADQSTVYYAKLNSDGTVGTWNTSGNPLGNGSDLGVTTRSGGSAVTANGYIYYVAGNSSSRIFYAKLNADGSIGSWTDSTNAISGGGRLGNSAVVANGFLYVVAGSTNNVSYATLNSDGSIGSFTTNATTLPATTPYWGSAVVANGYLYYLGSSSAQSNGTAVSTVYYGKLNANGSVTSGSWSTATNAIGVPATAAEPRWAATSTVYNGYIYEIAGNDAVGNTNNVYYASTERVQIGGSLDLVGLAGQNTANGGQQGDGSTGGSITAGDITAVGTLQVQGQGNFAQGLTAGGNLTVGGNAAIQSDLSVGNAVNLSGAGRIFSDGFESGNFNVWSGTGGSGTITPDATNPRSGKYAAKIVTSANGGYAQTTIASNSTLYARTYFDVATPTTIGNPVILEDLGTAGIGSGTHLYIDMEASGDLCFNYNAGGSTGCSTTVPSWGTWHKLETEVIPNGAGASTLKVWLDNTLVTSGSNALNTTTASLGSTNFTNFAIGNNVSSTNTVYYDDAAVDTQATGDSSNAYVQDNLHVGGTSSFSGNVLVAPANNSTNAFQVQNASGVNLLNIDTSGSSINVGASGIAETINIGQTGTTGVTQTINVGNAGSGATTNVIVGNVNAGTTTIQGAGGISLANSTTVTSGHNLTLAGGVLTSQSGADNQVAIVAKGHSATQTGDLFDAQNSNGTTLYGISSAGNQEAAGYYDNGVGGIGPFGNLLLCSEQFDNTSCGSSPWSTTTLNVTANGATSPDGQTTADQIHDTSSGGFISQNYTSAGNNTYTFSVWLKTAASTQSVDLHLDSNGTPATLSSNITVGTQWRRFSISQTFTSGVTTVTPKIYPGTSGGSDTQTVYAWGAQLVQSNVPQVYVRTTGAAVAASTGVVSNGGEFISSISTADVPLVIQAAPTQSSTLFQLQSSTGANLASIDAGSKELIGTLDALTSGGTLAIGSTNTGTGAVNIAAGATTGTVAIGGASQTNTITLGQSTAGQTINIGAAQVAIGNTQNIHIGDSATGTGKDVIAIGNTNGASSISLQAGTAGATLNATAGNLTLSTTTSGTLAVTSAGALNLTGAANSTWTVGSGNTLGITSSNFNVSTTGVETLGTASSAGSLVLQDGSGHTVTFQSGGAQANSPVLSLPSSVAATDTFCLQTKANCSAGASSKSVTEIVAMSSTSTCSTPSSVASSDTAGADYVATGCTAESAINSAISALPANGGVVYLEDGTYIISSAITLPSNVTLEGAGGNTILELKNGLNTAVDMLYSSTTISKTFIKDMTLDGNSSQQSSGAMYGMYLEANATAGVTVDHVTVQNFRTDGILTWFGNITIENTTSSGNGNDGFDIGGSNSSITDSIAASNTSRGFYDVGSRNSYTGDQAISNGNCGFYVSGTNDTIGDSQAYNNTGHGIATVGNVAVTGSSSYGNTLDGINIDGSGTASGNIVYNNSQYGIDVQFSANATVTGNQIYNNAQYGIGVFGSSYDTISNNAITLKTSIAYDGIYITTSDHSTVTGNNIAGASGDSGYAIDITGTSTSDTFLAGNTYAGTGASTIHDGDTTTVYGSQVTNSTGSLLQQATGITQTVGTGNYVLNGAVGSTYAIGAATTTGTIAIGGGSQTGTLTLGQSTANQRNRYRPCHSSHR